MDAGQLVFTRTHRVCLAEHTAEHDASAQARQFDAVAMTLGFKLSGDLLTALSRRDPSEVIDIAVRVLGWARELAGAHIEHNAYFIDFPRNVPDTEEFWSGLLAESLREYAATGQSSLHIGVAPTGEFFIDLLSLPGYGRYQHTYAEMLAHHEELVPLLSDRMTVIHLGQDLAAASQHLFAHLAGSAVPLSGDDLDALRALADECAGVPPDIPVRENLAVINAVRLRGGVAPRVGTVTDVLRLAAELSGTDVTLAIAPRFRSMRRVHREALLAALDGVINEDENRLADVASRAEVWKRLGERLHPHEYPRYPAANAVFAVARGERRVPSTGSVAEDSFRAGAPAQAAAVLRHSPGTLWRSADRLLRLDASPNERAQILRALQATAGAVSGRVLLGVREHLANRTAPTQVSRVFTNRRNRAWAVPDARPPLDAGVVREVEAIIDSEIVARLPDPGELIIDPAIEDAALPLSGKPAPAGLGVWPRGSVVPVEGERLRFFVYWRQTRQRTDLDLSALFTDENLQNERWLSYTNLRDFAGEHSGDITSAPAPEGATEFINVRLDRLGRGFIIPQVYVFAGERFNEVEENFFGFMIRARKQKGAPFEPRTVRMKSALTGQGRTVMPLVFMRGEDGRWYAKWLHLYLRGRAAELGGYRIEENRVTTRLLVQSIMTRDYLRVGYLTDLLRQKATSGPVTYIGVDPPEDLPEGSVMYTLANLGGLIPA